MILELVEFNSPKGWSRQQVAEEARNVIQDAGSQLELLLEQGGGAVAGSGGSNLQAGRPTSSGASAH